MNRLLLSVLLALLPLYKNGGQPEFKGGQNALNNFLSQNLIYPEFSRQNCISGIIQVSFNLDANGKVSHVAVYKGLGIDLDDEAVRVVKLTSGRWIVPAGFSQNENVILPIKFNTQPEGCKNINRQTRSAAIEAYKHREALVSAVTNYYSNKYLGKADTTKEKLILALKEQLGFDDEYITQVMTDANRKFKQGDHEGACEDWLFIHNIGSDKADGMLGRNCR